MAESLDKLFNQLTMLLPASKPLTVVQQVLGPILSVVADEISDRPGDIQELESFNNQLLFMAKGKISTF